MLHPTKGQRAAAVLASLLLLAACQTEPETPTNRLPQLPAPPVSSGPGASGDASMGSGSSGVSVEVLPGDGAPGVGNDLPRTAGPSGDCGAASLQTLVGAPLTDTLVGDLRSRSGVRNLRIIRPGEAVTMDYSPDRLNIEVDAIGRIQRVRCG